MQLAVLGKTAEGDTLREMCEHERGHLKKFNELVCFFAHLVARRLRTVAKPLRASALVVLILTRAGVGGRGGDGWIGMDGVQLPKYRVRPTALLPLWDVAGYALGVGSALMGKEAAYAVTVAVETVRPTALTLLTTAVRFAFPLQQAKAGCSLSLTP